jgi:hypothetical protein
MDLKDVFGAEPKSTWQVLCERGTGFYIPAYQRDYTWERDKIERLIEDSLHGLRKLVDNEDAITFLGTLIVIHDTKYQTVEPHVKGNLPGRVLLVIDGQQRLTTLLLLNTVLHEELSRRLKDFQDDPRVAFQWVSNKTQELIAQLDATFREDMIHGDGVLKFYPRMIRAFIDSWSRKEQTARYISPIASCLHGYSVFVSKAVGVKFDYHVPEGIPEDEAKNHEFLAKNRKILRENLNWIAKGADEDLEFPQLDQLGGKDDFQETLFKAALPADVLKQITKDGEGTQKEKDRFNELMRLVLFAKFMMERVAVTVVTAKNEDYAFDMFEALNTTGEPLTAFETFRPKVIEAEKLLKYEGSPSQKSMKLIEAFLDQYTGAQAKHAATTMLLIPFALAETGDKLSKRLSDQRSYLRDKFEKLAGEDEKREFVKHLAHTAMFIRQLWPDEKDAIAELEDGKFHDPTVTLLCLDVLRASKHHITIGLMTRFFSKLRSADIGGVPAALTDFEGAIRAITAFFALWRGSRMGTAKIDSYYREILREGVEDACVKAFARRPNDAGEEPTADRLRVAFRQILKDDGEIGSKADWVAAASNLAVYKTSVPLARFLLYAATHDTAPDPAAVGLVKGARKDSLTMLTIENWRKNLTVEHVAPQSRPGSGWDKALHDDPSDLINRLGNLTLAPGIENASFGNRPWAAKRLMYRVLGTPTLDEFDARLAEAKKAGIDLSDSTKEILELARFLPHLQAIAEVTGDWTPNMVKARSVRLAELAWDRLAPWLEIK